MRTALGVFGLVAAFAGVEHGLGELVQTETDPSGLVIESWADVQAFEPLSGEPAMTVIPDLRITGVLAVLASLVLAWWSVRAHVTARDGWVMLGLSLGLLLVGGGFGPPLIGSVLGVAMLIVARGKSRARPVGKRWRSFAERWRLLLVLTASAYLALFPGVVLLRWLAGVDTVWLPALLPCFAFTGLVLTLVAASAHDRHAGGTPPGSHTSTSGTTSSPRA